MANFFPLVANNSSNISAGFVGNRIEELQSGSNLDFTGSGIVNLAVGNLGVTGGTTGQVLTTWGNGTLYWGNGGGGGGTARPIIEWNVAANANNQTFTDINVATILNNSYAAVYINGVMQPTASYTITGNILQINTWLNTTDKIAIGPSGGGSTGISNITANTTNAISNISASELGFELITTPSPIVSNGIVTLNVPNVAQFRTNANIGNVANANFNGNVLTFLTGLGTWIVPPVTPAGNTTEVQYNNAGVLSGSPNLTFNGNTVSAVNVFERVETMAGSVINLANAAYFKSTLTGPTTFTVTSVPSAPQVGSFILHVSNAIAGATFNLGTSLNWSGGIAPTLQSNALTTDILGFYTLDGGTSYYGYVLGLDVTV